MKLIYFRVHILLDFILKIQELFRGFKFMAYEVDFLPVGDGEKSGDAIALRFGDLVGDTSNQTVVVIDGGFQETGENLVSHIQEYYQTNQVDLVVSTHSDADHASGLEVVLEELQVSCLWMHQPWNHTTDIAEMFKSGRVTDKSVRESLRKSLESARNLETIANRKGIPIIEPFSGVQDQTGHIIVVGPTKEFYESLLPEFRGTPEPKESTGLFQQAIRASVEFTKKIVESFDIETLDDSGETTPENNSSTVILVRVEEAWLLFTGDAGIPALTNVTDRLEAVDFDFSKINFIQVPHHGSRRNVGPTILDRLVGPRLWQEEKLKSAFVSTSKDGSPKHPAKQVTNAFRRRGAPVHATQGSKKYHYHDSPDRGWSASVPLPLYSEVEN